MLKRLRQMESHSDFAFLMVPSTIRPKNSIFFLILEDILDFLSSACLENVFLEVVMLDAGKRN